MINIYPNFKNAIIKGLNTQYIEKIKLQYTTSIMMVKLTGKNFYIELKGNEEKQLIEDQSFSSWQWDVTPKESGIQKLDFIVSVILRVPGYEELLVKGFEANTIEVSVKVNPSFSIKFFIKKEWKYLTALLVLVVLVVLLYFIVREFSKNQKREGIMVKEGDTYNIGQAGAAGKFASSHNNTFVQSEQKVTLAEAAAEIQQLLKELEKKNPTATEGEKIAYVNVATNPDIKQRAIAALKAGGETAIEEFLDNPYVNVAKAIIKGWIKPE
jgi:preprotein translocase subunit YajC